MLITSKKQYLQFEDSLYFPECSIGFSTANNLYLILEEEATGINVSFQESAVFKPYQIDEAGDINPLDALTIDEITYSTAGQYHIYKINIFCYNDDAGNFDDVLKISYQTNSESKDYSIKCFANIVGLQPEVTVTLQNMKKFLSEDYLEAMMETDWQATDTDFTIYNRKVREYLMNLLTMETFVGSYKSLDAALNFFGYGALLDLREYWFDKNNDGYKWTSIKEVIDSAIDKSLAGYKKSNQLALVYQINETNGIDEDGLPTYVNVLEQTDEILFKLWTLERILEKDFLFLNSHIVDIVGEFQTVMGLEFNVILNDLLVSDIKLSKDIDGIVKIFPKVKNVDGSISDPNTITDDNYLLDPYSESMTGDDASEEDYYIPILRHSVLLQEPFSVDLGDPDLTIIDGAVSGHLNHNIFDIEKLVNDDDDLSEEWAYLTRYFNGDFGLLEFSAIVPPENYQRFKYVVIDTSTEDIIFKSKEKSVPISGEFDIICGIRQTGKFKILLYLRDHFGGYTVASISRNIEVAYENVDIKIGVYGGGQNPHDIKMWTTFDDTTGITTTPIINSLSESLSLARWTESDFDMLSTWTNLNQLNGIPLKSMKGLPMYIHGFLYNVFVYDIIGNGDAGLRELEIGLFEHKPKEKVSLEYDGIEDPVIWLQKIINLLNSQPSDGPFGKFNWDIHWYSNDPTADISDARPMLRGKAKEAGFKTNNYFPVFSPQYAHSDFLESYYQHDVRLFSKIDATVTIPVISPATSDLKVFYKGVQNYYSDITINDVNDLRTTLEQFIEDFELENIRIDQYGSVVQIFAGGEISIEHESFGKQYDVQRGVFNDNIMHIPLGSDIQLGEPVFAFIDEEFRIDVADVTWTLINSLTGKVITTQHAWAFRWVMVEEGSYSLKLETTYKDGSNNTSIAHGCYLVKGFEEDPEGINFWVLGGDFIVQ